MKYLLLIACLFQLQTVNCQLPTPVTLPNGWSLTPIGRSFPLGDLPLNMAVAHSGKRMAVSNNGQSGHSIQYIDIATESVLHELVIDKAWYGLAFSDDDQSLYVSAGYDNRINVYSTKGDQLTLRDSILLGKPWPEKIGPAGIAINSKKQLLYTVTRDDSSLYIIHTGNKSILHQIKLGAEAYSCILSPDHTILYVSLWGGDQVLKINASNGNIITRLQVGDNPNEIILNKKGDKLFVANANDNSVSVIRTTDMKVMETLNAALYADAVPGSTSNGLALSADEERLYIANADNNALAVFEVEEAGSSKSLGFIPVGWYPTNVRVVGKKVFVTNGKGFNSLANPNGPNPLGNKQKVIFQKGDASKPVAVEYIGGLFKGTMSIFEEPTEQLLGLYSKAVYANTPYSKEKEMQATGEPGNPIPMKVGDPSPIKYVFYIVKENRTYDQVLSDVAGGNGDTSLLLFGEKITPNQHALVKEFVLLDNFYVDGEVSADGHNWTFGAYATDYLEKNWPTSYGGRGGDYDAEGRRRAADNKGDFIWGNAKRHGVSYRTYGEFADDYKPNLKILEGHFCPYYTSWDETVRDTTRVNQWKRDFDSLLRINAVPQLNTLRLINDHTEGMSLGRPTPFAHVADNDWAVGLFIEHLSKSPIWEQSVVFIVEDDAQNGPDHVDAHRTTAYVAGGYVKRGYIDHTPYSTSSMVRTIELILGMAPMSQYDAAATPMWRSFSKTVNTKTFQAIPANVNLNDVNTKDGPLAKKSKTFDFSKEDRVNDFEFSEVIWKGVRGEHSVMPAPKRSAFVRTVDADEK
ncbi:MAG: beta-propeller fold lactonase family protein [Bacteroidota bacterium]